MKVLRKAFQQELDPAVTEFVSSAKDDEVLASADIQGSLAHAEMLLKCGLITDETFNSLKKGLETLKQLSEKGELHLDPEYEDVHMNVEEKLKELAGDAANHLHTARSRNDQVALDLRLYTLSLMNDAILSIELLMQALAEKAKQHSGSVMPGYTHLQRAQPVSFGHCMMAFYEQLKRDKQRFIEAKARCAISPLGAAALAGTSLPIKPEISAELLGLPAVFSNSIDAVTDRDFILDFLYCASTTGTHLSQIAETLIIWMSEEFKFIKLPDSLTTASSLMPQKKNPDLLELVRAKSGTFLGDLVGVFTILKGLPQGYNRDLQDTKPALKNSSEALKSALYVVTQVIGEVTVVESKTVEAASDPSLMATDIAEYLVSKGAPFREAYNSVASLCADAAVKGKKLNEFSLSELKEIHDKFENDVFELFDPFHSLENRSSPGGTSPKEVQKAASSALKGS